VVGELSVDARNIVDLRTILARPVERRWFVIERAAAGRL
jgi:hypothetical protein